MIRKKRSVTRLPAKCGCIYEWNWNLDHSFSQFWKLVDIEGCQYSTATDAEREEMAAAMHPTECDPAVIEAGYAMARMGIGR